jgi:branched-chain amino acid aminotransferase
MLIAPILRPRNLIEQQKGLKATISSWQRIGDLSMPPRVKAGANYINGRYAHLDANRKGFDVPLLLGSDGKLAEGAGACLFLVRDNVLVTPQLTSSVLESITRDTVLRLAAELGYATESRPVDRTELLIADEAFLCGSAAEISAITSVDHMPLGSGAIGAVTSALAQSFFDCVSGRRDVPENWLWPAL